MRELLKVKFVFHSTIDTGWIQYINCWIENTYRCEVVRIFVVARNSIQFTLMMVRAFENILEVAHFFSPETRFFIGGVKYFL